MTRINAFIPPSDLCDKHLMAEHREIIRIPNQVKKGKLSDVDQPLFFKLGSGHVKFFRNKLKFLHDRYINLYIECRERGFNVQDYNESFKGLPIDLYRDFRPSVREINRITDILKERINERMPMNAKFTNKNK